MHVIYSFSPIGQLSWLSYGNPGSSTCEKKVAAGNLIKKPYINWAVKRVARSLQVLWPRSRTNVFGSNATGLALPTSDVDLVVCLPPVRNLVRELLMNSQGSIYHYCRHLSSLFCWKLTGELYGRNLSKRLVSWRAVMVLKKHAFRYTGTLNDSFVRSHFWHAGHFNDSFILSHKLHWIPT